MLKLFILTLITGCSNSLENTGSSEYLNIELTEVASPRYLKDTVDNNISGYVGIEATYLYLGFCAHFSEKSKVGSQAFSYKGFRRVVVNKKTPEGAF